jgi:diguanylate cyclase (GGDEF)-like protein/PAS domain S-box-containing protein
MDFYHKVFEFARDAIFIENVEGRIIDVNSAACELLQYTREELLNMGVASLLPLDGQQSVQEVLQQETVIGGKAFVGSNIKKDGSLIPVEVRVNEFWHENRQYLLVIVRDITERLEKDKILRQKNADLTVAYENVTNMEQELRKQYDEIVEHKEEIDRQNGILTMLHETSLGLMNGLDFDKVLTKIISSAAQFADTEHGWIYVLDEVEEVFVEKIGLGIFAQDVQRRTKCSEGLVGLAYKTGEIMVIDDYSTWVGRLDDPLFNAMRSVIQVPLKAEGKVIGAFALAFLQQGHQFTAEEVLLLSRFAELAAIALMNAKWHTALIESKKELQKNNEALMAANEELSASEEELRLQFEELLSKDEEIYRQNIFLTSLHETTLGLIHKLDLNDVFKMIISCATRLLDIPNSWVSMVDEEKGELVNQIAVGDSKKYMEQAKSLVGTLSGQVYSTGEIGLINDYSCWEHRLPDSIFDTHHCVVIAPLKVDNKVVGVLGLTSYDKGRTLSERELGMFDMFARLASIALDNAMTVTAYKKEIQERRQTEEALRISENRYKNLYEKFQQEQVLLVSLINSIPDLIFYKDPNGVYLGCNKAFEEFSGRREQELVGRTDMEIFPEKMAVLFRKMDLEMMTSGASHRNEEVGHYPDGREVFLDTLKTPYYDQYGNLIGLIGISRDITEGKKSREKILFLSSHDTLTGTYNRNYFEEAMKGAAVSERYRSLIVCDVDGLKIINDTLGHNKGDCLLRTVAEILKDYFQDGGLVARIGGDEFAVLLPHNSSVLLENDCRNIRKQVELYNKTNETMPISLSMGYAISGHRPVNMHALFQKADNNMYREKLHRQKSSRSAIVQALMKALEVRDFQTEGHGERMKELMETFAMAMGVPEHTIADFRLLAQFHDIGKVGVPDHILFKPGKLTDDEYAVMCQHSDIGYRIALTAPDLVPIADWILKHHERWDGKGYPLGISGEEIPLACRLLAIVDAYDAMTSDRPYRKAMTAQEAVAELVRCAGVQFDPALVHVFVNLV